MAPRKGQPDEEPARQLFRHGEARIEAVAQHHVAEHQHHHHREHCGDKVIDEPTVTVDQFFNHEHVS
jgi:hypothetical protein